MNRQPSHNMTPTRRRVHISKYITNVNIVGANVSIGAADREGVNHTPQTSAAAVQRFLPS